MGAFSQWIPGRLKMRARTLQGHFRALKVAAVTPRRPVFVARHSSDVLATLSARARAERDARGRSPRAVGDALMRATFRDLQLREVIAQTHDAVTLVFDNPSDNPIRFLPGQFLTLIFDIEGQEVRRAYSFCSDPAESATLALTVKRVPGGLVSNHICDHLRPGDRIRTLGPGGHFGTRADAGNARHVVLVGGGSGITPLFSIAQSLLRHEPESRVTLVYGNRSGRDIIFREALAKLADDHDALTLIHALESHDEAIQAHRGRLDHTGLAATVPVDTDARYFICGPTPMMDAAMAFLGQAGVDPSCIMVERFVAQDRTQQSASEGRTYAVQFLRSGRMVQVRDDQTLLEAGLAAGVNLPFSCTMGGCGACKVRRISGDVDMEAPNCLSTNEVAEGGCLTCVGRPRSAVVLDI